MYNFHLLKKYLGLVFDLDGTIVNSMDYHILAWQEVIKSYGFDIDSEYLASNGGVPSAKIAIKLVNMFGLSVNPQELAEQKTIKYQTFIPKISIYPKILVLLEYAKSNNIPMVIGTGTLKSNVLEIMKNTRLDLYINEFVSSEDIVNHKPNPDTFILASQRLGIPHQNCLVFEDAPLGIEAAKNAKMDCCKVTNGEYDLSKILAKR